MTLPEVAPPAPWSPPPPLRIDSGPIPAYVVADGRLPLVSVRIQVPIGSVEDGDAWGTAALAASMTNEAAGGKSALERAAALDRLAARFGVHVGRDWTTFALDVHSERLDAGLELLADAILRHELRDDDWERVHKRHVTGIEQGLDDNAWVAGHRGPRLMLGDDDPIAHPADGTVDSTTLISLAGVRAWLAEHLHAQGAIAVIVGDVDPGRVGNHLGVLSDWKARPRADRGPAAGRFATGRKFLVAWPESAQTVVRWLAPAPTGEHADRLPLELARVAIGGSFTSRLNQRLREEKGFTYGARLALVGYGRYGLISAGASVRADATAESLADTIEVLGTAARDGLTELEVERARNQALTDVVDAAESRSGLASVIAHELEVGRDPMALATLAQRIAAVSHEAVDAAAKKWFDPENGSVLLVGDPEGLAALGEGFEVVEPE